MSRHLSATECRDVIADLAMLLPKILRPAFDRRSLLLPDIVGNKDETQRNRWDPVFTGGCIVGFLITDAAASPPSLTKDLDTVIQIHSYGEQQDVERALSEHGFRRDLSGELPVEAWLWHDVRVGILPHMNPITKTPMNPWFEDIIETATRVEALPGRYAWIASAPAFLASKCVAFLDRGRRDPLKSKDLEDILAVIDGRPELEGEVGASAPRLRYTLRQQFSAMLEDEAICDALPSLIPDEHREAIVINRMRRMIGETGG